MEHILSNNYLQYGALGVVFFQTILFLILGKIILTGAAANRKAYEHLTNEILIVIIKNTEAMTQIIENMKALKDDHIDLQSAFYLLLSGSQPPWKTEKEKRI